MVIWVAVLPRVDQLTKVMPNFWRAVYAHFHSKMHLKCHLENGDHLVSAAMCWYVLINGLTPATLTAFNIYETMGQLYVIETIRLTRHPIPMKTLWQENDFHITGSLGGINRSTVFPLERPDMFSYVLAWPSRGYSADAGDLRCCNSHAVSV